MSDAPAEPIAARQISIASPAERDAALKAVGETALKLWRERVVRVLARRQQSLVVSSPRKKRKGRSKPCAANFDSWFTVKALHALSDAAKQELRIGLLYECFRRRPEVLRAKLSDYIRAHDPERYAATLAFAAATDEAAERTPLFPWLDEPWNRTAYTLWRKPWNKLSSRERRELFAWTAAAAAGPAGVSLSVSELLPNSESEVCWYIPPKLPVTIVMDDGSVRPVERVFVEARRSKANS